MEAAGDPVLAWHFLPDDGMTAGHETETGDPGKRRAVERGQTLWVMPPLVLGKHGLHWSRCALDALRYAPGSIVCRVRASGQIVEGTDEGCSSDRTCIAMADASALLHRFAQGCALGPLECRRARGQDPDERIWTALAAKDRWLRGEIDGAELDSARESARISARVRFFGEVVHGAEYSSNQAVIGAADRSAYKAAWRASVGAACYAGRRSHVGRREYSYDEEAAVISSVRDEQNAELERRLCALLRIEPESQGAVSAEGRGNVRILGSTDGP